MRKRILTPLLIYNFLTWYNRPINQKNQAAAGKKYGEPNTMSLDKGTKEEITKKFQLHEKDTGSADVQIAILTERITELTDHLKRSPKDNGSRLALLKLVGQRRRLLDYLNSTDTKRYQSLIAKLKLRR